MPTKADPQLFENQICFPLYTAANAVVRAYRPLLKALDLTYLQYMAIMVLWEKKELNLTELGRCLHLDSGTLTPLVKRLDNKGLVTRTRSSADERVRLIAITDKGMALKQKAKDIPGDLYRCVGMSKQDTERFKALCNQLINVLEA